MTNRTHTDHGDESTRPPAALDRPEAEQVVDADDLLRDPEKLTYTHFPASVRRTIKIREVELEHDGRCLVVRLHLADGSTCSMRGLRQDGQRTRGDDHLDMIARYYEDRLPDRGGFEKLIYIAGEKLPVVRDPTTDSEWDRLDVGALAGHVPPAGDDDG